ncbi:hypothetical protein MRB53_038273 [Persea americana]|nr:hypothetical protein MRB53_038273 [Persea americana]
MASSRIFVKGLPPSITDADFRQHFSKFNDFTDAKVFPQRRIGYVGFKSPEDAAARAVKYFNKSFMRMSRIGVELARDVTKPHSSETEPQTKIKDGAEEPTANPLKRKRHAEQLESQEDKLKEYLISAARPNSGPSQAVAGVSDASSQPRRAADPERQRRTDKSAVQESPSTVAATVSSTVGAVDNSEPEATKAAPEPSGPAASDGDWVRSRTSRLLDLEDDDKEHDPTGNGPTADSAAKSEEQFKPHGEAARANVNAQPQEINGAMSDSERANAKPVDEVQSVEDPDLTALRKSKRLFLRNLAYTVDETALREYIGSDDTIEEVHISRDKNTGSPKGTAFVLFNDSEAAYETLRRLDGSIFQGRLLHVMPADPKRDSKLEDYELAKLPLKKQKQIQHAVMTSVAQRLGVAKSDLLDPTSSDSAVKQAQAETHVIAETKAYFEAHGVDLSAFQSRGERSEDTILAKNLTYAAKEDDIRALFNEYGTAQTAFKALAYRKFKETPLFLEKAPKQLFKGVVDAHAIDALAKEAKVGAAGLLQQKEVESVVDTSTLYVSNLSFATTTKKLNETFLPLDGFLSANIKTKADPKKPGQTLSQGFGFIVFRTVEQAKSAASTMNGFNLDGHKLVIKASHKSIDAAEERRRAETAKKNGQRKSKLIIKNLPFEATKKDVQTLLRSYGQTKGVRLPKKFDNSRKGYAFAEFTTPKKPKMQWTLCAQRICSGGGLSSSMQLGIWKTPRKKLNACKRRSIGNLRASRRSV